MRILIVTDAWHPQINGVVRTLENLVSELRRLGHVVELITPDQFAGLPLPGYREIRLSMVRPGQLRRRLVSFIPDVVHIATEGPLGIAARSACLKLRWPFSTSYHTRFPEYLNARFPVPIDWTYAWLRRFHNAGNGCLVATGTIASDLHARGFDNLRLWTRGVDGAVFNASAGNEVNTVSGLPRPIFLNVGRVSVEKNLEAFLQLDIPGTKVVVGDGPALKGLRAAYPKAVFTGTLEGHALAGVYACSDVFVFPSLTDTFGNVIIEALACGLPVAAFPVAGPVDILGNTQAGILHDDLRMAALAALQLSRSDAIAHSKHFTWSRCAQDFLDVAGTNRILHQAGADTALATRFQKTSQT